MTHVAVLIEWRVREPEGSSRIDGISLHQTQADAYEFEKFWLENHDTEGNFEVLNITTTTVSDDVWKRIEGPPSMNKHYFRQEQLT